MVRPSMCAAVALALSVVSTLVVPTRAEEGVLVVQVSDVKGQPLPRVQLATKGDGSVGPPTDSAGRTRIRLASKTMPHAIVALSIVTPTDLVFISPWDNQVRVPPFENESQNFAGVVLAQRGERALLENGTVVSSVLAKMNQATSTKDSSTQSPVRPADALSQVSQVFGVQPSDITEAISEWSQRTTDPYDKGLASLYAGDLNDATAKLTNALVLREQSIQNGTRDAADAAFFLGEVLFRRGQYSQAAAAYRKGLGYRPGDPAITNNLGLTLMQAGDYAGAEPLLRLAITTIEAARGSNDPDIVFALNNLGAMLIQKGDIGGAKALFRRGLEIRRVALGGSDVRTANSMTNLASALLLEGENDEADMLLMTALRIFDAALREGPSSPRGASPAQQAVIVGGPLGNPGRTSVRLNQGLLALRRGRIDLAKSIAQEVLRDRSRIPGRLNLETVNATVLLARSQLAGGDASAAAEEFEKAIDMMQSLLGAAHPALADPLTGLGDAALLLKDRGRADAAYRRAINIRRGSFGEDDPMAADIAKKLATLGE